jgi:sugar lactone lactonase YvrE
MTVLIKLSKVGSDAGSTFDLYASPDGITFTLFAQGINKTVLVAGYTATVPDGTTKIKVTSVGGCTNSYISTIGVPDNSPPIIATPVNFPENSNIWNLDTQILPIALVIDSQDNVYTYNINNTITKFTSSGVKIHPWTTGNTVSSFMDMAIDSQDNIYTITYDGRVSRTTPDGITNLNWARGGTTKQIAIDSRDNVYITDDDDSTPEIGVKGSVMKITPEGVVYNKWAITQRSPYGIVVDSQDNIVVSYNDYGRNFDKITPQGVITSNWAVFPFDTSYNNFGILIVDTTDNMYVTGSSVNSYGFGYVYKVTSEGLTNTTTNAYGDVAASLSSIATDSLNNLYISNVSVQVNTSVSSSYYTQNTISKVNARNTFENIDTPAWLDLYSYRPNDIAFDSKGNLYVACANGTGTTATGHVLKILA